MNEDRLRDLLQADPTAAEREAEERGWAVVRAAHAERAAAPQPRSHRPLVLALAGAALLLALALSPAGAHVGDWIENVVEPGVEDARPALTSLPGGGSLVVETGRDVWVMEADGSQRQLGDYREAAPSPGGAFVAATSGHQLAAVVADAENPLAAGDDAGTVRWKVSNRRKITDPAWAPSGYRVAYRAGDELHVVAGDGDPDQIVAEAVASVPPAWRPLIGPVEPGSDGVGTHDLAYVDPAGQVVVRDVDTNRIVARVPTEEPVRALTWAPDGRSVAAIGPTSVTVVGLSQEDGFSLDLDGTLRLQGAAYLGGGHRIALVSATPSDEGRPRTSVLLLDTAALASGRKPLQRLFATQGRITDPIASPDGKRVLLGWRDADQWLFLAPSGGKPEAVSGITRQFDSGDSGYQAFPRPAGWCCAP